MKTLSIDTHAHDPARDEELLELLKEGQDPGESPGDDEESTVGVNPPQAEQPTPAERGAGTMDAQWGENNTSKGNEPLHFSGEVIRKFRENRENLLDKLFDGKGSSEESEQQLVSAHLQHASDGQFETRSSMLRDKSKLSKTAMQTLTERVRAICGRH